jgi:hypothetical protein
MSAAGWLHPKENKRLAMHKFHIHSVHLDMLSAATIALMNTLRILSTTLNIIIFKQFTELVYCVLYHHRTVKFYVHLYL